MRTVSCRRRFGLDSTAYLGFEKRQEIHPFVNDEFESAEWKEAEQAAAPEAGTSTSSWSTTSVFFPNQIDCVARRSNRVFEEWNSHRFVIGILPVKSG
ncbi:hypothetical protein [Nitrosovibrio tenuis]|uniref:hypothetical protein n=1 Tax=Nitrosovibrio tenuis TaxID=1233 RepID=UPI00115FD0DC|nr:hypothetical protein [Nitrosovibrio tenuis]